MAKKQLQPPSHELPEPVVLPVVVRQNFVCIYEYEVGAASHPPGIMKIGSSAELRWERGVMRLRRLGHDTGGHEGLGILRDNSRAWEHGQRSAQNRSAAALAKALQLSRSRQTVIRSARLASNQRGHTCAVIAGVVTDNKSVNMARKGTRRPAHAILLVAHSHQTDLRRGSAVGILQISA